MAPATEEHTKVFFFKIYSNDNSVPSIIITEQNLVESHLCAAVSAYFTLSLVSMYQGMHSVYCTVAVAATPYQIFRWQIGDFLSCPNLTSHYILLSLESVQDLKFRLAIQTKIQLTTNDPLTSW